MAPDGPVLCSLLAHGAVDASEDETAATMLAVRWNAVADALAEYDNPYKSITSTTAHNMADILRRALNGEAGA